MMLIGFPLIGLAGTILAWRRAPDADAARGWLAMLALLAAAFLLSLLVQRTGGFVQGCALPGAGWLLGRALEAIGRQSRPLIRVTGSTAAILALSPIGAMIAGTALLAPFHGDQAGAERGTPGSPSNCFAPCTSLAPLARLPRATILTGLDLTPRLLLETPHSYAASGHHRGRAAIHGVIAAFTGPPEVAHRLMREKHMAYLLVYPDSSEAGIYAKAAPNGLMARLLKGDVPVWLQPVPLGTDKLKLWRRVD